MKKFIVVLLLIVICLSAVMPVYADDYVFSSGDNNTAYYTNGKDVDELFDFTLGDIPKVYSWIFQFKTFTVFKASKQPDGTIIIKGYFNTPNLQMLAKNQVTSEISNGYTNETYNVNDDQDGLVPVGTNAEKENAITKYGFSIPSYTYFGEYPQEYMAIKNIVPTGFFQGAWRFIKSIFGLSFIEAPDSSNYQTISYYNHGYKDREESLVSFIQEYWPRYFVGALDTSKFKNAAAFRGLYTTEDVYLNAKSAFESSSYVIPIKVYNELYTGENAKKTSILKNAQEMPDGSGYVLKGQQAYDAIEELTARYNEVVNSGYSNVLEAYNNSSSFRSTMNTFLSKFGGMFFYITFVDTVIVNPIIVAWYNGPLLTDAGLEIGAPAIPSKELSISLSDIRNSSYDRFMESYNNMIVAKNKWETFKSLFNSGGKSGGKTIYYNQCLIENEGDSSECWSTKFSDEQTTLAIGNVYAFSGVDKVNRGGGKFTKAHAIEVVQKLQSYCGPYYKEVMANILICMLDAAKADGHILDTSKDDDPRVMPYDIDSMAPTDRENFVISDPRVDIYKSTIFGSIVSDLQLNGGIGLYFKPQSAILDLAGRITKLSVFFQQLINFDLLDSYGLSPANLWTNAFVFLIMFALALFFILRTLKAAIEYFTIGTGNITRVLLLFLILVLELGIFSAILVSPDATWSTVKDGMNVVMNLGETTSVAADPTLEYLFGTGEDRDYAVAYYIPYLDTWSQYNTGHGLVAREQLIDNAYGKPELVDLDRDKYTIDGKRINHWSVLLMDSFEFNGYSESIHSIKQGDKRVNGKLINNNAYRVVDHFLAPRVNTYLKNTSDGLKNTKIEILVEQNENYNGQFQRGFLSIINKLLNVVLICFLSLIKLLTFLWLWVQLYLFLFKVLIEKNVEGKTWKEILAETFSPLLGMIGIGIVVGICIYVSSVVSGIIGFLVQLGLYALVFMLIRWWSMSKTFPRTLRPLAILLSLRQYKNKKAFNKQRAEAKTRAEIYDVDVTEDDMSDPDSYREKLFDSNGNVKQEYFVKDSFEEIYADWANFISTKISTEGYQPTSKDIQALQSLNAKLSNYQYDPSTFKKKPKKEG